MFASQPQLLTFTTDPHNSDIATRDTITAMQQIAVRYSSHPLVYSAINEAMSMMQLNNGSSAKDKARAVFYWVKQRMTYSNDEDILTHQLHQSIDEYGSDLLITPDALLMSPYPMGDCDDFSMLGASMLTAIGIPWKYVTVAANPQEPNTFSHVYLAAYVPNGSRLGRLALDMSHGLTPGWEYKKSTRMQEW